MHDARRSGDHLTVTPEIMAWGRSIITAADVEGQDVLEVGASNYNGSLKEHVVSLRPLSYRGIDAEPGGNVDEILDASMIVERYGRERFGFVLSTEMLEHAAQWQAALWNMKTATRTGGVLVLTTRSIGFPYHPCPGDWWRFGTGDLESAFADWEIEDSRPDPVNPGAFIRARRPLVWDVERGYATLQAMTVHAQRQG